MLNQNMEQQQQSSSSFLAFFFTFFLFLLGLLVVTMKVKKSRNLKPRVLLPPGPWKLPIIGNMHHLMIGIGVVPIHHKLRDLAVKYGPVMHLKLGEVDHIVISSPEAAREVTKTHDLNFASRPKLAASKIFLYGGTNIAFAPYGDYWRHLRKLCTLEVLSARRVRSFSHIREEETRDVLEQISSIADHGNPTINLAAMLVSMANSISCRAISSRKDMYRKKFVSALEDVLNLGSGFAITDLFPSFGFIDVVIGVKRRLERARLKFDEIMDEIIKEHQERTAKRKYSTEEEEEESGGVEDLVDVLLRIKDDEDQQLQFPLTVDNIKAVIFDMFSGGTETTSTILTWAMAELVKNPKVMKKVQMEVRQILKGKAKIHEDDISDLQYLKLVIKETLRLHPPLPLLLPRACGETCEVGGFTIPSGARVMINVWALGRDPGVWDDAETFRPERFDGISCSSSVDFKGADHYGYLPFGSGRRICPGITFGLATIELVLAKLLYHFNWELPDGMKPEDLDMTETFGITARKTHDLYLHAKLVHAW